MFRDVVVVDVSGSFSTEMKSVSVSVGENATFSCMSDSPVNWQRQLFSSDKTESERICYGAEIMDGFKDEFAINIDRSAPTPVYELVVLSADKDDAGEYTCIEDTGLGASVSANLTVHGKVWVILFCAVA